MAEKTCIIQLPEIVIRRTPYGRIPQFGVSTSGSEKSAVSNYISRYAGNKKGVILKRLREESGTLGSEEGLEKFAVGLTVADTYENGQLLSPKDIRLLRPYLLAMELATKNGKGEDPAEYFRRAKWLLNKAGIAF